MAQLKKNFDGIAVEIEETYRGITHLINEISFGNEEIARSQEVKIEEVQAELDDTYRSVTELTNELGSTVEALQDERDNITGILDSMEDGVSIVSQQYDIEYMNPALIRDFGQPEGKKCYELFHDRKDMCPWCKIEEVFEGATVRCEWHSAGTQKTYDLIDTPFRNSDGSISRLEILRDITERQLAEQKIEENAELLASLNEELTSTNEELTSTNEEIEYQYEELNVTHDDLIAAQGSLKESQERLRTVINSIPSGVILIDAETRHIVEVNPAAAEMIGVPEAEIIGKICHQFICKASSDASPILDLGQQVDRSERILIKADGTEIPILKSAVKVTLEGREYLLESFIDITERKLAEEALRESEGRYRRLIQNMSEGIGVVDLEENFVFANPAAERIFGVEPGMLVGRSLFTFLDESEIQKAVSRTEHSQRGESCVYELILVPQDDELRHLQISASPQYGSDGSVKGTYGLITDITERKRLEEQLRQTQKLEAIGTLAGGIAHDFNNILCAILGLSELAGISIPEDNPAFEKLLGITIAGNRAAGLVKQILTFARKTEKSTMEIHVAPIVKEVVKMLRATLPTTIRISIRPETERTTIDADPTEIHQVIMNLCTNAGQAMMEHGGALEICLSELEPDEGLLKRHPDMQPKPHLVLSVSDNGPGMPPEIQQRIFEPFFTTKESGQGTGLGLAVVHGIIRDLGGAIDVDSEVGRGTVFKVYIPLAEIEPSQDETETGEIPRGTECILLVDDEPVLVNLFKEMLEDLGYTAEAFTSSEQALKAYMSAPDNYDVIMTDQTMPNLTGAELAEQVLAQYPTQPIILSTGFSHTISRKKAEEIGIAAYLTKPVSMQHMGVTIRRVLDGDVATT